MTVTLRRIRREEIEEIEIHESGDFHHTRAAEPEIETIALPAQRKLTRRATFAEIAATFRRRLAAA